MRSGLLFAATALLAVILYKIVSLFAVLAIILLLLFTIAAYWFFSHSKSAKSLPPEGKNHSGRNDTSMDVLASASDLLNADTPAGTEGKTQSIHDLPSSLEMGNYQESGSSGPSAKG